MFDFWNGKMHYILLGYIERTTQKLHLSLVEFTPKMLTENIVLQSMHSQKERNSTLEEF